MREPGKFLSVDAYFRAQPEPTRKVLLELRDCILTAAPQAEELLNYNIPAYALVPGGKRDQQMMIAGYKNHVGFYPNPHTLEKFGSQLTAYKMGKGSVQFPLDKPLPKDLIVEMVKYRWAMLQNP